MCCVIIYFMYYFMCEDLIQLDIDVKIPHDPNVWPLNGENQTPVQDIENDE